MFTLAQETMISNSTPLSAVPERLQKYLKKLDTTSLLELRLRCGGMLYAVYPNISYPIKTDGTRGDASSSLVMVTRADIDRAIELITDFSMYAFDDDIKKGFVTLPGGHRVGICGDCELSSGKISHLKTVQSLNYRFSREIKGLSDNIMEKIYTNGEIRNTLLVAPPMCGKTTMLRDIARNLSLLGKRVSIIDERGEIAAVTEGISPFDLGNGCDILSGVGKSEGMLFMLRSMSPDVIITDEIGSLEDFEAIREIKKRGVSVIASLHGKNISASPDFENIINLGGLTNV